MREEEIMQITLALGAGTPMARMRKGWNSLPPWPAGLWWNRAATCAAWWAWARTGWARLAAWRNSKDQHKPFWRGLPEKTSKQLGRKPRGAERIVVR